MMRPDTDRTRDSDLIDRARKADQSAYRSLYELHVGPLFRFLSQFSPAHGDVEEWVQRAFIKGFGRLDRFDGRSSFATWLFSIALNEMRSDRRKRRIIDLPPDDADAPEPSADEAPVFEWRHDMRHALDRLDTTRRAVFMLHEVEGFSHREIGEMLDIGESHSRTILTRVRSYLRRHLQEERRAQ